MAKKKDKTVSISQEDITQAQSVLEQFHDIAEKIHESVDPDQVMTALSEIEGMPEATQIAVLKALAKEHDTDAADVVNALNGFATLKNVRKEAKRALIQLQGAKIYPEWEQPTTSPIRKFEVIKSSSRSITPSDDFLPDFFDDDDDEDEDEGMDLDKLDPMSVVINFIENWVDGDYDTAYRLLTNDSPLRQGLSKREWVDKRIAWAEQAEPSTLQPNLIQEREPEKPKLWLPRRQVTTSKIIEAGWSIELNEQGFLEAPPLPELPKASSFYKETGRHWFWAAYTLVQERGVWRIQSMSDEVANLETSSVQEVRTLIQQNREAVASLRKQVPVSMAPNILANRLSEKEEARVEQITIDLTIHFARYSYYADALIKKGAADKNLYNEVAANQLGIGQLERCAYYVEGLIEQYSEDRAQDLRGLGEVLQQLSTQYFEKGDEEKGERFLTLAEQRLIEALTIQEDAEVHISLAEVIIEAKRFGEAQGHLERALALTSDAAELAHIEMHLGEVADGQGHPEEALTHYQRAAELQPEDVGSWANLAEAYYNLGNLKAADDNYRHAIELEPENEDLYVALSKLYDEHEQPEKSIEVVEDGLSANPSSTTLLATIAMKYILMYDYSQAETFIKKIERIDPDFEMLPILRATLLLPKTQQKQTPRVVESKRTVQDAGPFRLSRPKKKR